MHSDSMIKYDISNGITVFLTIWARGRGRHTKGSGLKVHIESQRCATLITLRERAIEPQR